MRAGRFLPFAVHRQQRAVHCADCPHFLGIKAAISNREGSCRTCGAGNESDDSCENEDHCTRLPSLFTHL